MTILESHRVPFRTERIRLSDYLPGKFKTITSRNGIKKAIKKGLVKVDGRAGSSADYLLGGELIELCIPETGDDKAYLEMDLEVLYEDEYLAVINKPAGIEVSGNKQRVLVNALPFNLEKSKSGDALSRPKPVHRLDYLTSGVLLVGKTNSSVARLGKLFEDREVRKIYHAVTIGKGEESGIIETHDSDKIAISEFRILHTINSDRFGFLNLTELIPLTGRRHQLRIHMAGNGTPILGDSVYGQEALLLRGKGLYLHATSLKFRHPVSDDDIFISCPLPAKMVKLFPGWK